VVMTQIITQVTEKEINEVLHSILPQYLIPKLRLVKKWAISEGKVQVYYYYLKYPIPFNLKAVYNSFYKYLKETKVNPNATIKVGGSLHKYEDKKILEIRKIPYNKCIIEKARGKLTYEMLISRVFEGITFIFWARGVRLHVFKDYNLKNPLHYIYTVLKDTIRYDKELVRLALQTNTLNRLRYNANTQRDYESGAWNIQL